MFHQIDMNVIRSECRNTLENLEIWLRNVIDNELSNGYGNDYLNYEDDKGMRLIKSDIVKEATGRKKSEPQRYPRLIDAFLLDDEIKVVCNPNLYKNHFAKFLCLAYPDGNDEARTFLNRLIPIRNKLYHGNPISIREAERAFCYSNDIIDSIKEYYKSKQLQQKYNVPSVIKVSDSFGNQFYSTQIIRNSTGRGLCDTRTLEKTLYPGDVLTIEVEIDPSFEVGDYTVTWVFDKKEDSICNESFKKLTLNVQSRHIRTDFAIYCEIKSKEGWHRCGDVDDSVAIIYEILPRP